MSISLPYVTSPGNIDKALNGIKSAAVPEKVTQDFVKTILKIKGGSGAQMTSFLKKIGFADTSGSPTERYKRYRNSSTSGAAVAEAMKQAYAAVFEHNEYAFKLSDDELVGIIVEITGQASEANPVKLALSSFKSLREHADFTVVEAADAHQGSNNLGGVIKGAEGSRDNHLEIPEKQSFGLNLGYTININLPATDDVRVFDAIFTSIKKNLMSNDDA